MKFIVLLSLLLYSCGKPSNNISNDDNNSRTCDEGNINQCFIEGVKADEQEDIVK